MSDRGDLDGIGHNAEVRIVSWKRIARYLQCSERTARRWRSDEGLPVHSVSGSAQSSVFAFKSELDDWLTRRDSDASQNAASDGSGSNAPNTQDQLRRTDRPRSQKIVVVVLLLLAAVIAGVIAFWSTSRTSEVSTIRVAMLPLNYPDGVDPIYARGFEAELRNRLVTQLPVEFLASESAGQLSGARLSPAEVGRRLGVDFVWAGELLIDDTSVQLSSELTAVENEAVVWSQPITSDSGGAQYVPVRLARALAPALRVTAGADAFDSDLSGPDFDLFSLAMGMIRTREPEQIGTATRILEGLVENNPESARAVAALAKAIFLTYDPDPGAYVASRQRAKKLANLALELEPDLVEALKVAGFLAQDESERERLLKRAVAIDGGDAEAHFWLAGIQLTPERIEERIENVRRVVLLDPLWANSVAALTAASSEGRIELANELEGFVSLAAVEPWQKTFSQARRAKTEGDISQYLRLRGAIEPSLRNGERAHDRFNLFTARSLLSLDPVFSPTGPTGDVQRGILPSLEELQAAGYSAEVFWSDSGSTRVSAMPLFLKDGRDGDLVVLFEEGFSSASEFEQAMLRLPNGTFEIPFCASYLAVALEGVGRLEQANEFRDLARQYVDRWQDNASSTISAAFLDATLAASVGDVDRAVVQVSTMVEMGWPYVAANPIWSNAGPLTDDPLWRDAAVRSAVDPVLAEVHANLAREREEALQDMR